MLAAEAARRGLWVVIDLCYEKLIYDDVPHNLPKIFGDAMRDRLVLCGSASKAYAMTGWRCGWMVGAEAGDSAANALQSHDDVERELDHAEGRGRGADRTAAVRDATCSTEYQRAARSGASPGWRRSRACGARCRRARSTCFRTSAIFCRPTACARRSTSPTRCSRRARRHDRRRGVRRARLHPPLVRDLARSSARGRHAADSVRRAAAFSTVRPVGPGPKPDCRPRLHEADLWNDLRPHRIVGADFVRPTTPRARSTAPTR